MAGFGASSFHDQVQSVRHQIRNALEEDDDAASEWFDGTLSETAASSQAGSRQQCILGQHVMPQVGDHVVVLDPQLARWLVEPTGTILEVRCDGGHVKVEHDGAAREERYYNTGKDGVYQLALAPPMPSLVADPRPRFSLPRPPSRVEVKAASNVSQAAASNTIQQRPRYSEVRRSGSQSRQPTVAAVVEPEPHLEAAARSTSVSSSRPRYSELRKARRSAAMGEAPETCASSTSAGEVLRQPTDSLRQGHLQPPQQTAVPSLKMGSLPVDDPGQESLPSSTPTRSRYSELRKASRSPVRLSDTRSPTAPSETSLPKPVQPDPPPMLPGDRGPESQKMDELFKRLDMMERETTLLTKQLKELKASKQSDAWQSDLMRFDIQLIREECRQEVEACERRCMSSCIDQSRRHLEACEERLRQHFREETRQLLETAERQILGEVKERSLKILRSCGSPDRSLGPQPSDTNEEPEQEYETPNGEEVSPYYLDKTGAREDGLSRAELADSELSLQTIGSIARRVSASLGGRPGGAPATQRDNPGDSGRQPAAQAQRPKEQKERGFDLEQEMEHLADMRRFASQVLGSRGSQEAAGSRLTRDASQAEWRNQAEFADRSPRRATTPPPASPMFGHPVRAVPQSQALPRTAKAVPCAERWRRRPSASRSEAEPPCPWDEEPDTPPRLRDTRDARPNASNVWQHVDSEGRLIF
eukprot:s1427_g8.t1